MYLHQTELDSEEINQGTRSKNFSDHKLWLSIWSFSKSAQKWTIKIVKVEVPYSGKSRANMDGHFNSPYVFVWLWVWYGVRTTDRPVLAESLFKIWMPSSQESIFFYFWTVHLEVHPIIIFNIFWIDKKTMFQHLYLVMILASSHWFGFWETDSILRI